VPFLIDLLAGVLASGISVLVGKLYGSARPRVPRWLGSVKLTYVRSAAAGVLGISLSAGIGLSTSDHTHRMVSYLLWYGMAAIALVVVIVTTVGIDRQVRKDRPSTAEASESRGMRVSPTLRLPLAPEQQPSTTQQIRRRAADKALEASARETGQRERIKREIKEELGTALQTVPVSSLSPELRGWLAHERERGEEFIASANREKRRLAGETSFLESLRFGFSQDAASALARLTRSSASWSAKVQRRIASDLPAEAQAFEGRPPDAHPEPTQGDFSRLTAYIDKRLEVLTTIVGEPENDHLTQG
jgi:hypothetical protein